MNFLADESVDAHIVYALRNDGHNVEYITEVAPGIFDSSVLERANQKNAVLLTCDKDFGEMVFRRNEIHSGVILLRLHGLPQQRKSELVSHFIRNHAIDLAAAFSVVTERTVRIRRHIM